MKHVALIRNTYSQGKQLIVHRALCGVDVLAQNCSICIMFIMPDPQFLCSSGLSNVSSCN